MLTNGLQGQLFDLILSRYARRADAVDALCQLLHLAKDPIYRRLRGDTFLSPQELSVLAQHYQISLDALVYANNDSVVCNFNAFSQKLNEFSDYLTAFNADFEMIHRLPHPYLWYATAELPVFSYNLFPELIAFKLYIWGRTTWNFAWLREHPFSFDLLNMPLLRLSEQMLQHYLRLDGTELWTVQIMDSTLAQIEYHVYSGGFRDPKDALVLMDKLKAWTAHMRAVCAAGRKFAVGEKPENGRGKIQVFHNEMVFTNIAALIVSDVGRMAYAAYCTPNFLRSTDDKLCDYTQDWFRNILSKSTPLSDGLEKEREWFFRELNQKIERRRQRVAMFIEEGLND
jgi:hypothetical protein